MLLICNMYIIIINKHFKIQDKVIAQFSAWYTLFSKPWKEDQDKIAIFVLTYFVINGTE